MVLVLLLWASGLCAAGQLAKVGVPFAELAAVYPEARNAIGWMLSLIGLLGIVLGLVAGVVGTWIGARALLLGSLAVGTALSLIQALLPPFPVMLGLRVIEGLSHLGIAVAAPTLIGTFTPPAWRPAAMTLWGTFFAVAFALTAWAGTPLVEAHGPAALFVAHGIAAATIGILLLALLPREANTAGDTTSPAAGPKVTVEWVTPARLVARHRDAYASPRTAAPALGWLFYNLTLVALLTALPQVVEPAHRTFVAGAMPLAGIAVSLTLGVALLRVRSAVFVVQLGFALGTVIAALIAALGPTPVLCVTLIGTLGLIQGASFAAVPELNPDPAAQSLANGARVQMGNLGNVLGTPVLLAVLAAGGVGAMMAAAIGCYVTAIGVGAVLAQRRADVPR